MTKTAKTKDAKNNHNETNASSTKSTNGETALVLKNEATESVNRPPRRWRLCTLLRCTCRCGCDQIPEEIPIYHSSICSLINYTWLTPFIWRTHRKGFVEFSDIWPYPKADSCDITLPV